MMAKPAITTLSVANLFSILVDSVLALVWFSLSGRSWFFFNTEWLQFTGRSIDEAFYRGTGSNVVTFPGMGIGLFLSAEIIRRHQGHIWVESRHNKGSKFSFTIHLNKSNGKSTSGRR